MGVDGTWLSDDELAAWVRLVAVVELLPGVLDSQLRKDAQLTSFEYYVLAMLSEAPRRTLRMTVLATQTNATLPRLSHVVRRLQDRGLVERLQCPQDGRVTNARLTTAGWRKVRRTAPGHVATVRQHVMGALTPEQVADLRAIAEAILHRLDPDGTMSALYQRYDRATDAASDREHQVAQAIAAERESLGAVCRSDPACLERLLAADFHEFGASGVEYGYQDATAHLGTSSDSASTPMTTSHMRGSLVADGVVMVKYTYEKAGRRSNRTSLWRRVSPGSWQMFHHQGTPAAE